MYQIVLVTGASQFYIGLLSCFWGAGGITTQETNKQTNKQKHAHPELKLSSFWKLFGLLKD